MVFNASLSWNQAKEHCLAQGGRLFALDSYEQWYILMENMNYAFQKNHFHFWLSTLIYLGNPRVQRVSYLYTVFLHLMCIV